MNLFGWIWAVKRSKKYTDDCIASLPNGIVWRGSVNYYADLPEDPEIGDAYTVKYEGTSGTVTDGSEYAWGEENGTNMWVRIGPDAPRVENDTLII